MIEQRRAQVAEKITDLIQGNFRIDHGRAKPDTTLPGMVHGPGWDELDWSQRKDVLTKYVDWKGFDGAEVTQVITRAAMVHADQENVNVREWFMGPVHEQNQTHELGQDGMSL